MKKVFKIISVLLVAVLVAVMLSSVLYINICRNHCCSGVNCRICYALSFCESALKSLRFCAVSVIISYTVGLVVCSVSAMHGLSDEPTPIMLKVKLSN